METNTLLEQKMWSITRPNPLDRESFIGVIDYLFARLSEHLQQPLTVIGEDTVNEDSFSRSFRGVIAPPEPFRITFVGVTGMDLIGDKFEPHISASLFLFGDHIRLTAEQPNRSYIELSYERNRNNTGRWCSLGWKIDEFEEFEDINEEDFR